MSYFILQILPYITVTIFVLGVLWRLSRWAGGRIVHNITITPAPTSRAGALVDIAEEVVFFRSIFKGDKKLWGGAWIFHVALFAVLGGHLVGIYTLGQQFTVMGVTAATSEQMSNLLGICFGIVTLVALLYLLYRRCSIKEVKYLSATSDYLHLLLLIAIVTIGDMMRLIPGQELAYSPVHQYIGALVSFTPINQISQYAELMSKPLFPVHILLVQILLLVFPYSKLMHLFGMFAHRWIINRPYNEPANGLPGAPVGASTGAGANVSGGQAASGGVH